MYVPAVTVLATLRDSNFTLRKVPTAPSSSTTEEPDAADSSTIPPRTVRFAAMPEALTASPSPDEDTEPSKTQSVSTASDITSDTAPPGPPEVLPRNVTPVASRRDPSMARTDPPGPVGVPPERVRLTRVRVAPPERSKWRRPMSGAQLRVVPPPGRPTMVRLTPERATPQAKEPRNSSCVRWSTPPGGVAAARSCMVGGEHAVSFVAVHGDSSKSPGGHVVHG
mmetsp:Transcript_3304/g.8502  ORF Transcript_3304/g.8502 Transcript_3304/m.8502 type:complete len:224 (-) Transcript_3304:359-1030(-)